MQPFLASTETSKYFYEYNSSLTLALAVTVTLDHEIDHGAMQEALKRAVRTYPHFCSRLAFVDGRLWFIENEHAPRLHRDEDTGVHLGGADTDYYLWRAWAKDALLSIVVNHGIADGRCLESFVSTLLYYYAVERGEISERDASDAAGIVREGDLAVPGSDPFERYGYADVEPQKTPDIGPVFSIPETYWDEQGEAVCDVNTIVVPAAQLRRLAHASNSRISPLIMALEAQAMGDVWDTRGASMLGPITNDMRSLFDSGGVSNFSSWVIAVLPAQLVGSDLPLMCGAIQQAMEAQLNEETMRAQMGRSVAQARIYRTQTLDEAFGSLDARMAKVRNTRTYVSIYVSNIGRLTLPQALASMVKDVEFSLPSFTTPVNLTMTGTDDVVRMCISTSFEGTPFARALANRLEEAGVGARVETRGRRTYPTTNRDAVLELDRI